MSAPPLLIAQISDLHIKARGELCSGRVDTAAALTRCIDAVNRLMPRPQLVVISGDLVDTASRRSYDHLLQLLAPLQIPFAAIPGNHDDREMMRVSLPDRCYASATGPLNSARAVDGLDIILIDSVVPGAAHGELAADSVEWLEATLGATSTRPALLFLHHPPFMTGIRNMDVDNLHNAGVLAGIVQRHPRTRLIGAGHVHRAAATMFGGRPASICPAPNLAVALDLGERLPPSFTIEPPAFHLHVWFPDQGFGNAVTHLVPIGDFDGPHSFFGPDGEYL